MICPSRQRSRADLRPGSSELSLSGPCSANTSALLNFSERHPLSPSVGARPHAPLPALRG
jgi:hypothetical protein